MATFVLVHGAWYGGWSWARVRKALTDRGHAVFTPTLTGVGERSHLLAPDIDLQVHINDVANLILWEDLSSVVLCGHSYGGCVVGGVADRLPHRISSIVYLDAFLLEDGQSLHDVLPEDLRQLQLDLAAQYGNGWRVPPIPAEVFNVNPADRDWVDRQSTPQSLASFQQPIRLQGEASGIPNHYVCATDWGPSVFTRFYEAAKARGWATSEIASGHNAMLDSPAILTDMLASIADASG